MHEIKYVTKKLNQLFEFKRGIVISQKYINQHKGEFPVYSSQTKDGGVMGYIDTYIYDGEYITWTTDGVHAGTTFYRKGKFNCTNVCGIMILKEDIKKLSLKYINSIINFKLIAKSSGNKKVMSEDIIKADLEIKIPVCDDGTFDIIKQEEIANNYNILKEKSNELLKKRKEIETISIDFTKNINTRKVKITDLFSPTLGSGKYTKKECLKIQGDFPVYSGNTVEKFESIHEYMYDGEYLTWAKDGLAGYLMYHNEKFSITNHRGILMPTKDCKNIDLHFIKYVLEPIFRRNIKGRLGLEGKNEYTTLSKEMIKGIQEQIPIPITENGEFDLEKQKEIANKIEQVSKIKQTIMNKIDELININVILI